MSKDEFFKDRYETPDRETVLEAENKRLKARIEELEGKWHYLPELPGDCVEVLIAIKYDTNPVQGLYSYNRKKWIGSRDVRDSMVDGYVNDADLYQDMVYAWTDLPRNPPMIA